MFHYASNYNNQEIDLCIIGSGFAGLAVAEHFLRKNPRAKVGVFESAGNWHGKINAYAFGISSPKDPYQLYQGEAKGWIGNAFPRYCETSRALAYGGTGNIWSGWSWPFEKRDFKKYKQFLWPFDHDDIYPHYRATQDFLGLGDFEYDGSIDANLEIDTDFFETRFIQFHPVRPHHQVTTQIAYSPNVDVVRNATFVGFDMDYNNRQKEITRATFQSIDNGSPGKKITIKSRFFVFAMGALENTRQLLIEELGNDSGQLGMNFIEHFYIWEGATFELKSIDERIKKFYFSNHPHPLANGTSWMPAIVSTSALEEQMDINGFRVLLGGEETVRHTLNICCEQEPNLGSQIRLSKTDVDLLGRPRMELNPKWTKRDENTIYQSIVKPLEVLEKKGMIKNIKLPDFSISPMNWDRHTKVVPGNHPMGVTRISSDPNEGVADSNCRVYGTTNLYLTGSGCFPTGGSGNPTFTIVALAYKLAAHLDAKINSKN